MMFVQASVRSPLDFRTLLESNTAEGMHTHDISAAGYVPCALVASEDVMYGSWEDSYVGGEHPLKVFWIGWWSLPVNGLFPHKSEAAYCCNSL